MSWSINIASKNRRAAAFAVAGLFVGACLAVCASAQAIRVPASVPAGSQPTFSVSGSGSATFYLTGPGVSSKSTINLGSDFQVPAENLKYSGQYLAVVCSDGCRSATFTVTPAQPSRLSFLVHPSRVPVGRPDAVSGVAFPFDRFGNLVLTPLTVDFQAASVKESLFTRAVPTRDGVAWFRTSSGKAAGVLHVNASAGDVQSGRVLQQVASEPCSLRIKGDRTAKGIEVETEPVRDCAGNPVSDGTIVTFTATGSGERDTVDAPIKGDVARARLIASGPVVISAASGVVLGNEVRIEGGKP
ncbi:MAG: hypothetical protein WAN03_16315 [Candidatus Sulfotelmatobacter sp.]